jgi:hypothetical protein
MFKKMIWLIVWIFILTGCHSDLEFPEFTETPIETIIKDDEFLSLSTTVSVVDKANEYDFPSQTLKIYEDSRYPGIPYVDVEAFMKMMSPGLLDYEIHVSDVIYISVPLYDDLGTLQYAYKLKIDPTRNRLTYNDFNFGIVISGEGISQYESDLELIHSESSESQVYQIKLDPYGIDLLFADKKIYMPLDLANLTLTGYNLNVYRFGGSLYIFDDFTNMSSVLEKILLNAPNNEDDLVDYTYRFTALMFDYFYGLKSHQEIDSYLQEFDERQLDESQTIANYSSKFQQFVFDQDDLHTMILDYGYGRKNVSITTFPRPYSRTYEYLREYTSRCVSRISNDPVRLLVYPEYYILEINQFNHETKNDLENIIDDIEPDKDVYIDLSCNSGGAIIAAIELLTYMTDLPIQLNYQNSTTGLTYQETYQAKQSRALSNRFYVITTTATFSAANIFTSIVKDMELAMIIGRPTSGGASAVSYAVLPNNLIMTYSTPLTFLNKIGEEIENGITPDYLMGANMSIDQIIDYTQRIYDINGEFDLEDTSTLSAISLQYSTPFVPNHMSISGFTVEYINGLTNQVIKSYEFSGLNFNIAENLPGIRTLVQIKITIHYHFHEYAYSEVIYQRYIDN